MAKLKGPVSLSYVVYLNTISFTRIHFCFLSLGWFLSLSPHLCCVLMKRPYVANNVSSNKINRPVFLLEQIKLADLRLALMIWQERPRIKASCFKIHTFLYTSDVLNYVLLLKNFNQSIWLWIWLIVILCSSWVI